MMILHAKPKLVFVFKRKNVLSKVDVEALDVYFTLTLISMHFINNKVP